MGIPTAPTADPGHLEWLVRRQPHPDTPGLVDLVDDVARFRSEDAYRRARVTEAAGRATRRRIADAEALWTDLLARSPRRPSFRLVTNGATTDGGRVTRRARIGNRDLTDLVAPNQVIDGYRAGATVVAQGLHLTDPALARFANNLALELDQPVQINAYLSPASARGLDVHFDYHDVFVVQLDGSKRWRVWSPTASSRHPIGGKHAPPRPRLEDLGEPEMDLVLEPGDVLYVPRGHPHLAETTDQPSSHLTVGLLAITWHRVVRRAVDEEIAAGRLRTAIPLSTLEPGAEVGLASGPDLTSLELGLTSVAVRRWVAHETWSRQASTRLRPLHPVDPAMVDDVLDITPGPLVTLSRRADRSLLFVGDRTLSLPQEAHQFLAAIVGGNKAFRRSDVPGLDDSSSRVVTARLLDEGILAAIPQPPVVRR